MIRWLAGLWLIASFAPFFHLAAMARDAGVASSICSAAGDGLRHQVVGDGGGDRAGESMPMSAAGCAYCLIHLAAPLPPMPEAVRGEVLDQPILSAERSQVALRATAAWKPALARPPPARG